MNSLYFNFFTILAVFATPICTTVAQEEDGFEKLFKARAPLKEIIAEIITIDADTNYEHFKTIQNHIQNNDEYAAYSKSILAAGQKILDHMLHEINHEEVNVENFIDAAYDIATSSSVKDTEMLNLVMELNTYLRQVFEDALEETKDKLIAKFLEVVDDATNEDAALPKKENSETRTAVEQKKSLKKRASRVEKNNSSVSEGEQRTDAAAAGGRKFPRSAISRSSSSSEGKSDD